MKKATIFAVVLATALALFAPTGARPQCDNKAFLELRKELRSYAEENIRPKMLEWKNYLDESMTSEDLAKLNELREKAAEHRQAGMRQMRNARNSDFEGDRSELRKQLRDRMRRHRDEMDEILDELDPLMDKYESVIDEIGDKSESYRQKWDQDMRDIFESKKDELKQAAEDCGQGKGRGGRGRGGRGGFGRGYEGRGELSPGGGRGHEGFGPMRSPEAFMLWNGEVPPKPEEFDDEFETVPDFDLDEEVGSYPNPTDRNSTIFFNLEESADVTIKLTDRSGGFSKTVFSGELPAGDNSVEIDLADAKYSNLRPGAYVYTITGKGVNKSGKLVLRK